MPDHVSEFRFAVPEPVSGIDPDHHPATPPTLDRLVQRERARRDRVGSFDQPMAKFHAMDLLDVQDHLSVICEHVKGSVPSLQQLSGLVPKPGEILDSVLPHTLSGDQLSTLCQLLDSLCWIVDEKVNI